MSRLSPAASVVPGRGRARAAPTPPGGFPPPKPTPAFRSLGSAVQQIYLDRLPGDNPGQWTACITQAGQIVMGTYDQTADTFTANQQAAAISSGSPFGLMLEPRVGRYAVFDRSTGVFFAARGAPGVNFTTAAQVTGVPGTYVDPALGYVGGRLKLFYVLAGMGNGLVMQDLDVTNLQAPFVTGTPVRVANATTAARRIHSPTPITGPDGDVEGLFLAERDAAGDSDMFFKPTLDPAVPHLLVVNGTNWRNNGGVAGGRLLYSSTGVGIEHVDAAWLLGDEEAPGGTLDVFGSVFFRTAPAATVVFLSTGVGAAILLPPPLHVGALGLDPVLLLNLGSLNHPDASQGGSLRLPLPNDPSMSGARLAIQGLSFVPATASYAFTNTAWLRVR
jgi:hypothetical protein